MTRQLIILACGIIIGIFITLQFKGCGGDPCPEIVDSKTTINTTSDTNITNFHEGDTLKHNISITSKFDSTNTVVIPPKKINKPKNNVDSTDKSKSIYTYVSTINKDTADIKIQGKLAIETFGYSLNDWKIDWDIEVPEYRTKDSTVIHIKDSTVIHTVNTVRERKNVWYFGSGLGFSENQFREINFNLTVKMKNDYQLYYQYSMPTTNIYPTVHEIGGKIPIRLRKR